MGDSTRSDRKRRISVFEGRHLRASDLPSEANALSTYALRADGLTEGQHRKAETIALWIAGIETFPADLDAQVSLLKLALLEIGDKHISAFRAAAPGRPQTWPFERRLQLLDAVDRLLASKQVRTITAALEHLRKHDKFIGTFNNRRLANLLAETRRETRENLVVLDGSISFLEGEIKRIEDALASERRTKFRTRPRPSDLSACLVDDASYEEWLTAHWMRLRRLSRKP